MRFRLSFLSLVVLGLVGCCGLLQAQTLRQQLSTGWEFKQVGTTQPWRPAEVPGCVHTDLLKHGQILDPYIGDNEKGQQWIGYADWEYRTTFTVPAAVRSRQVQNLMFEGLDTYASVYLNNQLLLEADNMFRTWRVPVKGLLSDAPNELRIVFHSALVKGMERRTAYPTFYPNVNEQAPKAAHTSTYTRKAPYHYGWDWGPRLITAGIYRNISIEAYNDVQVNDVFWKPQQVTAAAASGQVQVTLKVARPIKGKLSLALNGTALATKDVKLDTGTHEVTMPVSVKAPKLWWPNGLGAQPLYSLTARVVTEEEQEDQRSATIGFCSIKHVMKPDNKGRSFYFEINGKPTFLKGANYLPPDHFSTRADSAAYAKVINWAVESNMNVLRVWGGAVYADDAFYRICAEKGIVVWNEFMFACAAYPGDDVFINSIRAEATDNIIRVRNWPNIAIWSGNNENMNGVRGWFRNKYKTGESDSLVIEKAFQRIFYKELRERMTTLAPHISYWPTSPQSKDLEMENEKEGDMHYWGVYFGKAMFSSFAEKTGRFVSEYGIQSFPALSTLAKVEPADQLTWGTNALKHRQRSPVWLDGKQQTGNELIRFYTAKYFKLNPDFKLASYQSQLMQALCLKYAVEAHRNNMATCGGSMFWQINDTWPCISWSTVDYYGNWKAAQYQIKNHYRAVLPLVVASSKGYEVNVASDLPAATKAELVIRLVDFEGKQLMQVRKPITLSALASKNYHIISRRELPAGFEKERAVLSIEVVQGKKTLGSNLHYFVDPAELQLPKPSLDRIVNPVEGGYLVTLRAKTLLKGAYLSTKDGSGHFSDNYMDLLPGQQVQVKLTGAGHVQNYQEDIMLMSLWDTLPSDKPADK